MSWQAERRSVTEKEEIRSERLIYLSTKSQAEENAVKFQSTVYSEKVETERQTDTQNEVFSPLLQTSSSPSPHGGHIFLKKNITQDIFSILVFLLKKGTLQSNKEYYYTTTFLLKGKEKLTGILHM